MTLLRIDSSALTEGSVTRGLTDRIVTTLNPARVTTRDVGQNALPQITGDWVAARSTPEAERSHAQIEELRLSDELVAEIEAADTLVIGVPVYNFAVPAALKAWIDLIARVGVTFQYTAEGPKGLLKGKRAILAVASGGTPVGSEIDFATGYMRHVLGFVGITDVTIIAADALAQDAEAKLAEAHSQIDALATQRAA